MTNGPIQSDTGSSDGSRLPVYSDPAIQKMLEGILRGVGRALSCVALGFVRIFDDERQLDVYIFSEGQQPTVNIGNTDLGQDELRPKGASPERESFF